MYMSCIHPNSILWCIVLFGVVARCCTSLSLESGRSSLENLNGLTQSRSSGLLNASDMRHLQGLIGGETAAWTRCTAGRGLSLTHLRQRHSLLLTTVIGKQVRPWCWSMLHTDEIKKRKLHTDEITRNSVETWLNRVDARGVWSWMKCVRVAHINF